MKKAGLRDMKKQNQKLILDVLLKKRGVSRISLAQETGLAPSTITTLIGEMIFDGVIVETQPQYSTGGRRRMELDINGRYGYIGVVEVGPAAISLFLYNMALEPIARYEIPSTLSGDELFTYLTTSISGYFRDNGISLTKLRGLGLLFQEDVQLSDYSVMYSTSLSSATITLREALMTYFRIPVIEESLVTYSVSDAMASARITHLRNAALIVVGEKILLSIMLDGRLLPMKDGTLTQLPYDIHNHGKLIPMQDVLSQEDVTLSPSTVPLVSRILRFVCALFPIDAIFIASSQKRKDPDLVEFVSHAENNNLPEIHFIHMPSSSQANSVAEKVREELLCM